MGLAPHAIGLSTVRVDLERGIAVCYASAGLLQLQQELGSLGEHHGSHVANLERLGQLLKGLRRVPVLKGLCRGLLQLALLVELGIRELHLAWRTLRRVRLRVLLQALRVGLFRLLGLLLLLLLFLLFRCRLRFRIVVARLLGLLLWRSLWLRFRHLGTPAEHKLLEECKLGVVDQAGILLQLFDQRLKRLYLGSIHHSRGQSPRSQR
mmetsp:Transcript_66448/g.156485  ORF Transcript_66448/g.156485 Transcript_66448/m.156485 type:complete len:208 (+) Transcript_66448:901-1524(+)